MVRVSAIDQIAKMWVVRCTSNALVMASTSTKLPGIRTTVYSLNLVYIPGQSGVKNANLHSIHLNSKFYDFSPQTKQNIKYCFLWSVSLTQRSTK